MSAPSHSMTVLKDNETANAKLCPVRESRKSRKNSPSCTPRTRISRNFHLTIRRICGIIGKSNWGVLQLSQRSFDRKCEETQRAPLGRGSRGRASRPGRIMTAGVFYRRVDSSLLCLSVPAANAVGAALLPDLPHFLSPPGATRFRYTAQRFFDPVGSAFGGSDGPEGADGKGTDGT